MKKISKNIFAFFYKLFLFFANNYAYRQITDYKSIPIVIISFNQLFYLQKLVSFLLKYEYKNIIIVDNNSTYPPLLQYFKKIKTTVKIHQLTDNAGHMVFWNNKEIFDLYSKGYYIITDADIVPIETCPENFVEKLMTVLNENLRITKAGLSLKIDDIPDSNPNKSAIVKWESQFWQKKVGKGQYKSATDTTFALYKPNYKYKENRFYKAIRLDKPYQAYHGGWYIDFKNLSDEQKYYIKTTNSSSSWKTDEQGNLNNRGFENDYKN